MSNIFSCVYLSSHFLVILFIEVFYPYFFLFLFFFAVSQGFELSASHLQSRHSTIWVTSPAFTHFLLNYLVFFLLLSFKSSLCILDNSLLLDKSFANISSQFVPSLILLHCFFQSWRVVFCFILFLVFFVVLGLKLRASPCKAGALPLQPYRKPSELKFFI
jgi:hypothetical protein